MRKLACKNINPGNVTLALQAKEKFAAIEELLDLLVQNNQMHNRAVAQEDLISRERKMSTGLEQGIALPHAKTDAVEELTLAIGISPDGIDFDSLDQQPSHIILLLLSPKGKSGPHIEFLATVTQKLKNPTTREKIMVAKEPKDIIQLLFE